MAVLGYLWHPRRSIWHTVASLCAWIWLVKVSDVIEDLSLAIQVHVLDKVAGEEGKLTLDAWSEVLIDRQRQLSIIGGLVDTFWRADDLLCVVCKPEARVFVRQSVVGRALFGIFTCGGLFWLLTDISFRSRVGGAHSDRKVLCLELCNVGIDFVGTSLN